jgi:electron transfer flavoprotein beta subunit
MIKIAVCIKQVPTKAELRLVDERWTLAREGIPSRINDADLAALEVALTLRDRHGGDVVALTMGPPQSEEGLREAMAMGVDQAILLSDPALAGADTLATSVVLAMALRKLADRPDLVLCGGGSSDSGTRQVGPQLAEDLGLPHVAYVVETRLQERALFLKRKLDWYLETARVRLPALLTVLRSETPRRDISFAQIENAFYREVLRWGLEELGLSPRETGLAGSATWVRKIREPSVSRRAHLVQGTPEQAVPAIIEALEKRHLLDGLEYRKS